MDCSSAAAKAAGSIVCIVSPPDWRIYISPLLIACSAIIAILAMLTTRAVARQRATLDLIEKRESTEHYRTLAAGFSRIRRSGGFATLANPKTEQQKIERQIVVDYLNHYELISIGILANILDERIYRTWMRGPFTRDWNAAAAWIQRERWKRTDDGRWDYYERIFESYQKVASRWSSEAILLTREWGAAPDDAEAGGPGDEALPAPNKDGDDGPSG